jgi:hypothetical protein
LERVLKKALQKDPERRYQTADEMIADLEAARGTAFRLHSEDVTMTRIGFDPTTKTAANVKPAPRMRWFVSGLVAVLAALLLAGAIVWLHERRVSALPSGRRIAALKLTALNTEDAAGAAAIWKGYIAFALPANEK